MQIDEKRCRSTVLHHIQYLRKSELLSFGEVIEDLLHQQVAAIAGGDKLEGEAESDNSHTIAEGGGCRAVVGAIAEDGRRMLIGRADNLG